jgi:hypothetical protein
MFAKQQLFATKVQKYLAIISSRPSRGTASDFLATDVEQVACTSWGLAVSAAAT